MNRLCDKLVSPRVATVGVVLALGVAGCGGGKSSNSTSTETAAAQSTVPAELLPPSNEPGPVRARAIAKLSRQARKTPPPVVPEGFCEYTNEDPQPEYSKDPARLIVESLCQPPLGGPVGVYAGPTFGSEKVGDVEDGDVARALCINSDGQPTTNVLGEASQSDTWVKISHAGTTGFVSEVNLGYVDDALFNKC